MTILKFEQFFKNKNILKKWEHFRKMRIDYFAIKNENFLHFIYVKH
jgi:hypothetical protein